MGYIGYELRQNSYCSPYGYPRNENLWNAKKRCTDDPTCTMIYDTDGKNERFFLCHEGAETFESTLGSRVYIKGKYLSV